MANENLSFKLITDNKNTFFTNNKFISAESLPVEGDFVKGDIIVNIGETADTEAMWVCIESGNPGVWEVVGAGVSGGGGSNSDLICLKNNVTLEADANEVEIGIPEFNKNEDMMTVYKNSVYMIEGKDYEFNEAGDRIVAMNGEVFKAGTVFSFVVLKEVPVVEEGEVIDGRVIEDGSIGLDKLDAEVKEAIEAAGNIDMSEYVSEEELEAKGYLTEHQDLSGYATKEELNELFQDVDSGKTIIADAIDDRNINKDSTFAAMGEAIEGIHADREEDRQKLIEILQGSNMDLTGNESMDTLLDLIDMSNLDLSKVVQVACGNNHTFILYNDGSLWACGDNYEGQLGLNNNTTQKTFTQVTTNINNDVKYVACGATHTMIVKNDGSLWACGNNGSGQLGLNNTTDKKIFTQVTTNINNDVKQIACGSDYTFILKNDGSVWSCGGNRYGQLGLGLAYDNSKNTFTQVTTNINNDVKEVACGYYYLNAYYYDSVFILKNDGSVWACGDSSYGRLGLGDTGSKNTFTQVTTNINNDVKQIACGGAHTLILKNDGSVWSCGYNHAGQLGAGNSDYNNHTTFTKVITNVKYIACGGSSTFIIKNDGSLWACGSNGYGNLGLGDGDTRTAFTKVTTSINNDVNQIFCGGCEHNDYTFIIKNDGSLWACGYNNYGQLGLGITTEQNIFIPINQSDALQSALQSLNVELTMNRGNLATVLTDEGVELTGDETLADLIVKTDEEFDRKNANAGGGLDIISDTTLPATGRENQICVITDNPVNDFVITSNYSDINTNNTIYIFLGNSLDTTGIKGTNFDLVSNNITMKYYLLSVHQGGNKLDSYIYKNNQWTNATMSSFYIVEKGTSVNESYTGGFTGEWVVGDLNGTPCYTVNIPNNVSAGGGTMCFDNCTVNKINVSDYTTLEYTIASTMPDYSFAGRIYMFINTTRNVTTYVEELYRYWETPQPGSFTTYTIDISDITGEFYLGIAYIGRGYGQKLCVSDIRLY